MKTYKLKRAVNHDNCNYEQGQMLALDGATASMLLSIDAVEEAGQPGEEIKGALGEFAPINLELLAEMAKNIGQIALNINLLVLAVNQLLLRFPVNLHASEASDGAVNNASADPAGNGPDITETVSQSTDTGTAVETGTVNEAAATTTDAQAADISSADTAGNAENQVDSSVDALKDDANTIATASPAAIAGSVAGKTAAGKTSSKKTAKAK